ncbi:hypothetical protein DY023_04170 [Microbacterium bovistercoris]|uniref:Uncharacterized protein n=1 Tax=Microbacterium bovistercoris TaxID=2293570 RepID=A0A371NW71_9MICO|nr:hypothetical protein [Microbacterium bovistercoris]REJ07199.1 hypothetical protein DY023_04170 [Microbacterium bovistercoris]
MAEDHAAQSVEVRSALPTNPSHIDPKEVERVVFETVGHRDLGLRIWHESREAAEQAWRDCRARMRARFGARSPHGWSMIVLFGALLCAAVAAVLTSGFRFDPAETATAVAVLAGIAGLLDLAMLLAWGLRPVNWAAVRMQIGLGIALGAASAFQLSRPATAWTAFVVVAGVIGAGGVALVLIVRALRPEERHEVDTMINNAVAAMQPEVDATAARLKAQVDDALSVAEREQIVALRTRVLADLAAEGLALEAVPDGTPAGGVIISAMLERWHPYANSAE